MSDLSSTPHGESEVVAQATRLLRRSLWITGAVTAVTVVAVGAFAILSTWKIADLEMQLAKAEGRLEQLDNGQATSAPAPSVTPTPPPSVTPAPPAPSAPLAPPASSGPAHPPPVPGTPAPPAETQPAGPSDPVLKETLHRIETGSVTKFIGRYRSLRKFFDVCQDVLTDLEAAGRPESTPSIRFADMVLRGLGRRRVADLPETPAEPHPGDLVRYSPDLVLFYLPAVDGQDESVIGMTKFGFGLLPYRFAPPQAILQTGIIQ